MTARLFGVNPAPETTKTVAVLLPPSFETLMERAGVVASTSFELDDPPPSLTATTLILYLVSLFSSPRVALVSLRPTVVQCDWGILLSALRKRIWNRAPRWSDQSRKC